MQDILFVKNAQKIYENNMKSDEKDKELLTNVQDSVRL